jgi:hypothetical protein
MTPEVSVSVTVPLHEYPVFFLVVNREVFFYFLSLSNKPWLLNTRQSRDSKNRARFINLFTRGGLFVEGAVLWREEEEEGNNKERKECLLNNCGIFFNRL